MTGKEKYSDGSEPTFPVLYLGRNKDASEVWAFNPGDEGKKFVVFKVKMPKGYMLFPDPYSYGSGYFTTKPIPASALTIIEHGRFSNPY